MELLPKTLVFVVPGLSGDKRNWTPLLSRLKAEPGIQADTEAYWEFWHHGLHALSFRSLSGVALELKATLDQTVMAKGSFSNIVLVGHSVGALLVREAYLRALNAYGQAGVSVSDWPTLVSKFILFASISRGVDTERMVSARLLVAVGKITWLYPRMTVYDMSRGSAFVTDLRLAWIRRMHALATMGRDPTVVQFLGTTDTVVTRADSIDFEQFPNGEIVDIPNTSHDDLYRINVTDDRDPRYLQIRRVFHSNYRAKTAGQELKTEAKKIVFVLHGIRSLNTGWVEETAEKAEKLSKDIIAIRSTYGYFSALHFFLPWVRRTRARWFLDMYSEFAAKYPSDKTEFYFIGHSNGTYMLGRGLERVKMMRFRRAYLAGSVLPTSYPWAMRIADSQLVGLRSDASAWDWPVGLLCSALSFMGDIGTGGFWGFEGTPPEVKQFRYYLGGHGRPLEDRDNIDNILRYVLDDTNAVPSGLRNEPVWAFGFASRSLKYVGPLMLSALFASTGWEIYESVSIKQFLIWAFALFGLAVFLASL